MIVSGSRAVKFSLFDCNRCCCEPGTLRFIDLIGNREACDSDERFDWPDV